MLDLALKMLTETPADQRMSGCEAQFIPLGNGWGLKFYRNEDMRTQTYDMQAKAFAAGIAPALGEKIDFTIDGNRRYGYLTECVDIICDTFARKHGIVGGYYENISQVGETDTQRAVSREGLEVQDTMNDSQEYKILMKKLRHLGFDTEDMHWGNVGHTKDGRLVAIDFSHC